MTDAELAHQIITLLKCSPLSLSELAHALRQSANIKRVDNALARMEQVGLVQHLAAVDLYALVAE